MTLSTKVFCYLKLSKIIRQGFIIYSLIDSAFPRFLSERALSRVNARFVPSCRIWPIIGALILKNDMRGVTVLAVWAGSVTNDMEVELSRGL